MKMHKMIKRFFLFLIKFLFFSSQQLHFNYTYILIIMFSEIYYELQKRFDRVTNNYKQNHYFTIIVVAIVYQMNRRVFFNRIRKCQFKFIRFVSNKRLNDIQKQIFFTYITKNDDMNMFLISTFIMKIVNYIFRKLNSIVTSINVF